jgi:SAM-dependent methyltransferase
METVQGDLYDYPTYYDLVFGSDWKAEFQFLRDALRAFADREVRRLFEPACGTGRLLFRLARAGYEVSGLDLNPRAVDFCNARLRRFGYPDAAFIGDMSRFRLRRKVDASFNMINSFRHLPTEEAAHAHLECMAQALRRGGVYLLGLHLTPTEVPPSEEESWSARRGNLCVNTRLWTTQRDLRRRRERFGMTFDVHTPKRSFRIQDEIVFRTYTWPQFRRLLGKTSTLELVETFDFHYDIKRPITLGGESEDVVFVLRKQ